jgi:DNA excision repair protein ERCC-2
LGSLQTKKILQKPGMNENERDEILASLKLPEQSHLLMAVMGGVFSEGVDYAGSMAIGVFVVSPALPKFDYERELLNRYYETKNNAGIQYAYIYPGINKVIQSTGRLIRAYTDKGIVLLIGERFAEDEFNELLPEYWFEKTGDLVITKDYKKAVRDFWKSV